MRTYPRQAWSRTRTALLRRMFQLGYRNAQDLARRAPGAPGRATIQYVLYGPRVNFDSTTFIQMEVALQLADGAIRRHLAGESVLLEADDAIAMAREQLVRDLLDRVRQATEALWALDEFDERLRSGQAVVG